MKEKKLPKFNYYDTFIENAKIALEMSVILKDYIKNYENEDKKAIGEKMHKLENDADMNLHYTIRYLIKDFLPPIDREDIILLANEVDDLIDDIEEIVINLGIFDVRTLREDIGDFIDLISRLCIDQKEMMDKFKVCKKFEDINELVIKINMLEEEGDRLYENSIRKLFKEANPIEMIKWEKIYTSLEKCFDKFEGIANTVGEIVMKNS